jgi:hypothetical protein
VSDQELRQRIAKALYYAEMGTNDGAHHKMWVIDQMVRALTGCPIVTSIARDWQNQPYKYTAQGESTEYLRWVVEFQVGPDGPETYSWDEGIAP